MAKKVCPECGKPKATKEDSDRWSERPNCFVLGDMCPCEECTSLCWLNDCDGTGGDESGKEE